MRHLLILVVAAASVCGCTRGDSDTVSATLPPGAGQPLNPNGKPSTPEQARMAEVQNRGAQAAAANINRQMTEMAEARKRAGGK